MKHVYGFVLASQSLLPSDLLGVHNMPVEYLPFDGVSAVVSDYKGRSYDGLPKEQLVRRLAEHQLVTETLMAKGTTLLPMKFGALFGADDISLLLQQTHAELKSALAALIDKVEIELVVTWDLQRVFAEIANAPAIADLRAQSHGKSAAELQQLQIAVGLQVKAALDGLRSQYQEKILDYLGAIPLDIESNMVTNDQVAVNLAFLVPLERVAEMEVQVELLDTHLNGELNFKLVGPLPPYSFGTVEIEHVTGEDIVDAQNLLGVGNPCSGQKMQTAYRDQARLNHPDLRPNDPTATAQFNEINKAYRLLSRCHAAQHRLNGTGWKLQEFESDFSQIGGEGIFVANIRRSSDFVTM